MAAARGVNELDALWTEALRRIERCWSKIVAEMRPNARWQGWVRRGQIETQRSSDPLLAYLKNARGADEHGIVDITRRQDGGMGIGPASGNSLFIEKLEIRHGQIVELKSPQPVRVTFVPATFSLVDVSNRGVTYSVPKAHLGNPFTATDPVSVAVSGIAFYRAVIAEIDEVWRRDS
jgi:hypothetical protein